MTTTLLILVLAAQAVIVWVVLRLLKRAHGNTELHYVQKATEWDCEITGADFSEIDLTPEVLDTVCDICCNPQNWLNEGATLDNCSTGTKIWVANKITSRKFYDGPYSDIKVSAADKWALNVAYLKHMAWQEKMQKKISTSELFEISQN